MALTTNSDGVGYSALFTGGTEPEPHWRPYRISRVRRQRFLVRILEELTNGTD